MPGLRSFPPILSAAPVELSGAHAGVHDVAC
jgi:hypothetical protein